MIRKSRKGPFGFLTVYSDPLDAPTPADVLGYWSVWKEMKRNTFTKAREHTVTHVDKDGPDMNTGVVHSVKIYWRKKGIHYDHKAQTQDKNVKSPSFSIVFCC